MYHKQKNSPEIGNQTKKHGSIFMKHIKESLSKMIHKNSTNTTSPTDKPEKTGMNVLENGIGLRNSLEESEQETIDIWIKLTPNLLKCEEIKSVHYLIIAVTRKAWRITHEEEQSLHGYALFIEEQMRPCGLRHIQQCLESIGSTFSCDVPNLQGLEMYRMILAEYPHKLLEECTINICKTYKYPRLPLPAEFLNYMDPILEQMKAKQKQVNDALHMANVLN